MSKLDVLQKLWDVASLERQEKKILAVFRVFEEEEEEGFGMRRMHGRVTRAQVWLFIKIKHSVCLIC